jgi:hypothetical protein
MPMKLIVWPTARWTDVCALSGSRAKIVELVKPWSALFHYAWNSGEERMASVLDSLLLAYLQRS